MALGIIIGFVVGAAVTAYIMSCPLAGLSEDDRNEILRILKTAGWRKKG